MKSRKLAAAIVLSVIAGCTAGVATTAAATDETPLAEDVATDHPTSDDVDAGKHMEPFLQEFEETTGFDSGTISTIDSDPNGLSGINVDYATQSVVVYWVGALPKRVETIINSHPDVRVTVKPAGYSLAEMLAARDRVSAQYNNTADAGELVLVGPDNQGRGIEVRIVADPQAVSKQDVARKLASITEVAPFAIEIGLDQGIELFSGGRQSDVSPHYGGAGVWITNLAQTEGGYCSTGAAVQGRTTGKKYMTTSLHCAEKEGQPNVPLSAEGRVFNGAGTQIGKWH